MRCSLYDVRDAGGSEIIVMCCPGSGCSYSSGSRTRRESLHSAEVGRFRCSFSPGWFSGHSPSWPPPLSRDDGDRKSPPRRHDQVNPLHVRSIGVAAAAVVASAVACGSWGTVAWAEERHVTGWRVATLSWAASEVEEGGRALKVAFWDAGGCSASRGPYFKVEEGREWVSLTVTVERAIYAPGENQSCPAPLVRRARYELVRLRRPLDAREIRGQTLKAPCLLDAGVSYCGGGRPIEVPNVVGFSFADAVRALAFDGLGASARGRPAARQRVVAQSPATEELRPVKKGRKGFEVTERVEVPQGTVVRLRVAPLVR